MGAEFVIARVAVPEGARLRGVVVADPDRLLSGPEVARLLGIKPDSWRVMVMRGYAPAADDRGDPRRPKWRLSTVREFKQNRRGRGRRTDLGR